MEITSPSVTTSIFDHTGKLNLDHVYNKPDPRDYFSTLSKLDYCVPELAKPFFKRLLGAKREVNGEAAAKIVDVGCSYGVNAALLKHDLRSTISTGSTAKKRRPIRKSCLHATGRCFRRPPTKSFRSSASTPHGMLSAMQWTWASRTPASPPIWSARNRPGPIFKRSRTRT